MPDDLDAMSVFVAVAERTSHRSGTRR